MRIIRQETILLKQTLALAALVSLAASCPIAAQPVPAAASPTPIKRTVLQKVDVPTANYEIITAIAEISPTSTSDEIHISVPKPVT